MATAVIDASALIEVTIGNDPAQELRHRVMTSALAPLS